MEVWKVLLLGAVQGVTEFLPVSSSGHLALLQNILGFEKMPVVFDALVHGATFLAVLVYFRRDIKRDISRKEVWIPVILATIPTAAFGLTFKNVIEASFSSPKAIGICFLVTALMLFLTKFSKEKVDHVSPKHGLLVGLFQCLALFPGISRSGATISCALYLGVSREEAGRFSFYIFIPAVLGAILLELRGCPHIPMSFFLGFFVAFLVGFISLRFLMDFVKKGRLHLFSLYCFILGCFVLVVYCG